MVGWSDNAVQIAAINSNVQATITQVHDEDGNPRAVDGTETIDGWWIDLDRAGINDLIKLLRKARDRAYGADA
jgi:hypothetical protein